MDCQEEGSVGTRVTEQRVRGRGVCLCEVGVCMCEVGVCMCEVGGCVCVCVCVPFLALSCWHPLVRNWLRNPKYCKDSVFYHWYLVFYTLPVISIWFVWTFFVSNRE